MEYYEALLEIKMIDKQQIAKELLCRKVHLAEHYLTNGIPMWPLQVAGFRVDELLHRSPDDRTFGINSDRACKALDQAVDFANQYMAQQRGLLYLANVAG